MRLVCDTNVLVSAALKTASQPGAVVRWLAQSGRLLKSDATEAVLLDVPARPRIARKIEPDFVPNLRRMLAAAERVAVTHRFAACRDPQDDKFLELAVNGRADVIVSGDAHLLTLGGFGGIPILSPLAFVLLHTTPGR